MGLGLTLSPSGDVCRIVGLDRRGCLYSKAAGGHLRDVCNMLQIASAAAALLTEQTSQRSQLLDVVQKVKLRHWWPAMCLYLWTVHT